MDIGKDLLNYGLNSNILSIVNLNKEVKGIRFIEFGDDKKGSLSIPFASTEEYNDVVNRITSIYTEEVSNKMFAKKYYDPLSLTVTVDIPGSCADMSNRISKVIELFFILKQHIITRNLDGTITEDFNTLRYIFRRIFFRASSLLNILHNQKCLTNLELETFKGTISNFVNNELKSY